MNELTDLEYGTGTLPTKSIKWWEVIKKIGDNFKGELSELSKQSSVLTATGYWLDLIGSRLEINRTDSSIYLDTDTEEIKTSKDNFYRTAIMLKATSLYDDFTFNIFNDIAGAFLNSGRLIVNIFPTFIQYSFIDLTDDEEKNINNQYKLLRDFQVGRRGLRIAIGKPETFKLNGTFNKRFSKLLIEENL